MSIANLTRNASNILGYIGRAWVADLGAGTPSWVDMGPVRSPSINITSVNREADAEGRTPAMSYDVTVSFTLLELDTARKNVLKAATRKGAVFFSKNTSVTPPAWNAGSGQFNGSSDGFLFENVWIEITASLSFSGEGDAYECQIQMRLIPAEAAALFDGVNNAVRLP
ncbi:MAG: hypothetical protein KatS3mg104_2955 [Phycisphaerae bacterium]|nr:MAG: hypothetical protein KatS3mg104_2955 [Phycisphaerae bacterium]